MGKLIELLKLFNYKVIAVILAGVAIIFLILGFFNPDCLKIIVQAIADSIGGD